jgi:hypothetical protein
MFQSKIYIYLINYELLYQFAKFFYDFFFFFAQKDNSLMLDFLAGSIYFVAKAINFIELFSFTFKFLVYICIASCS